jgi:membrane protein YdbS with pleckstrin-like domain
MSSLHNYIGYGETIRLRFKISFRYITILSLFWIVLFGVSLYYFSQNPILVYLLGICLGLILTYILVIYWTTDYFVTEKKIYRKTGFLWTKVIGAGREDVSDFIVQQSILDRWIYRTGSIQINTAGSPQIEIILSKVADPHATKKRISQIWEN